MSAETETAVEVEAPEAPEADAPPAEVEPPAEQPPTPIETPVDEAAPEPAPEPAPQETSPPREDPAEEDLSNLLTSDEPEIEGPRVRVASDRERVDRSERMRNYYARVYRPAHNPSRAYFAARGAYALSGTSDGSGGGRMAFVNVEGGQTWNFISYGIGGAIYAGGMTFGEQGVEKFSPLLAGGGPSIGLGRLGLFGRGYLDLRIGYNFFYAPISSTRPDLTDPPNAAPHGPKVQLDIGLLLADSESRRFRHGLGATIGWQMLVHSFTGEYPRINTFTIGLGYFFG